MAHVSGTRLITQHHSNFPQTYPSAVTEIPATLRVNMKNLVMHAEISL
jgi:hypothetical protein